MGWWGPGGVILKAQIPLVSGNLANGKYPTQRIFPFANKKKSILKILIYKEKNYYFINFKLK